MWRVACGVWRVANTRGPSGTVQGVCKRVANTHDLSGTVQSMHAPHTGPKTRLIKALHQLFVAALQHAARQDYGEWPAALASKALSAC